MKYKIKEIECKGKRVWSGGSNLIKMIDIMI